MNTKEKDLKKLEEDARKQEAIILKKIIDKFENKAYSEEDEEFLNRCMQELFEIEKSILKNEYSDIEVELGVNNDMEEYYGLYTDSKNLVEINKKIFINGDNIGLQNGEKSIRLQTCFSLFETIIHEMNHCRQFQEMKKNKISYKSWIFQKVNLLRYYDESFYQGNYYREPIEIDSRIAQKQILKDILVNYPDPKKGKILIKIGDLLEQEHGDVLDDEDIQQGMVYVNEEGFYQDSEYYINEEISKYIDVNIINEVPILEYEYNVYGTRKNLIDTFETYIEKSKNVTKTEMKELQKIFYDIMTYSIENSNPFELEDFNKYLEESNYNPSVICATLKIYNEQKRKDLLKLNQIWKEKNGFNEEYVRKYENIMRKFDRRNRMFTEYEKGNMEFNEKNTIISGVDIPYTTRIHYSSSVENQNFEMIAKLLKMNTVIETNEQQNERSQNETEDMLEVVNACALGRLKGTTREEFYDIEQEDDDGNIKYVFSEEQVSKLFRLLKAADNISVTKDYISRISSVNDMDYLLNAFFSSDAYRVIEEKYEKEQNQDDKIHTQGDMDAFRIRNSNPFKSTERLNRLFEVLQSSLQLDIKKVKNLYSNNEFIQKSFENENDFANFIVSVFRISQVQKGYETIDLTNEYIALERVITKNNIYEYMQKKSNEPDRDEVFAGLYMD